MRHLRAPSLTALRAPSLTALLATLALAACQTPPDAPPAPAAQPAAVPAAPEEPTRVLGERNDWVIEFHEAGADGRPFCKAWRPGVRGARLVFVAGAEDSGFRLSGVGPRRPTDGPLRLQAVFDDGERVAFRALVEPGPSLTVSFPTARYDDEVHAFARALRVEFRGPGGALAGFDLTGTNWALNALDECRRLHAGT
ncbi:hypothetical protein [Azospirillum halopraeferens]|uniref:hypothetical protein n=1 Tax=Azospirillum halopraeferens TaxID=34010 RepID=UPI0003FF63A8|nr:hypothetical protein [Azospirillum halopraeferens]